MKTLFRELFEYNHHFNQKLAKLFNENAANVSEKSIQLFSHVLNAHQIWNNRIYPQQPLFNVWDIHPVQHFEKMNATNFQHSLSILDYFELNVKIDYVNSKGQAFNNDAKGILFHIINHSTYHRGQIATEFRLSGIEPLATDYIFYKR